MLMSLFGDEELWLGSGLFCECLLVCCPKKPEKVCVTLLRPSGISYREVPQTDKTRKSVAESVDGAYSCPDQTSECMSSEVRR